MTTRLAARTAVLAITVTLMGSQGCSGDRGGSANPAPPIESAPPPNVMTPEKAVGELGKGDFNGYWHMGLAELSRYDLQQARYGEVHNGEAVLVFVTEDFLEDKQVKYEHGDRSRAVPILKLNAYRRFNTGIYPYTVLTSTFSPVASMGAPLKVTSSIQEWCGHAYLQLNKDGDGYRSHAHSYFQDEADKTSALPSARLEDGLWSQARRDPSALPTGSFEMIPALHYLRLMHKPLAPLVAKATLTTASSVPDRPGENLLYRLEYGDQQRVLSLTIEGRFPHRILAWEETGPSIMSAKPMTTKAVLTNSIMLDYWNRHNVADAGYRDALGLIY